MFIRNWNIGAKLLLSPDSKSLWIGRHRDLPYLVLIVEWQEEIVASFQMIFTFITRIEIYISLTISLGYESFALIYKYRYGLRKYECSAEVKTANQSWSSDSKTYFLEFMSTVISTRMWVGVEGMSVAPLGKVLRQKLKVWSIL